MNETKLIAALLVGLVLGLPIGYVLRGLGGLEAASVQRQAEEMRVAEHLQPHL